MNGLLKFVECDEKDAIFGKFQDTQNLFLRTSSDIPRGKPIRPILITILQPESGDKFVELENENKTRTSYLNKVYDCIGNTGGYVLTKDINFPFPENCKKVLENDSQKLSRYFEQIVNGEVHEMELINIPTQHIPGSVGKELCHTDKYLEILDVTYTQGKEYIVLRGREQGNIFMSGNKTHPYYRHDWYEMVGEYDSYDEAKEVIDEVYRKNPFKLFQALHNSMSPDKI
jgi:hypothetical protein